MKNLSFDNNIEIKDWGEISLIKNNKKGLKEKAVGMCIYILESKNEDLKKIYMKYNLVPTYIELEYVIVFLLMIDKLAFKYLGEKKRNVFINELSIGTLSFIAKSNSELDDLMELYNERLLEYNPLIPYSLSGYQMRFAQISTDIVSNQIRSKKTRNKFTLSVYEMMDRRIMSSNFEQFFLGDSSK